MLRHLPPRIKRLLSQRCPDPRPGPPQSKLHAVLSQTLNEAIAKNAERGWLVLSTCAFLTMNRPSAVKYLYCFATRSDPGKVGSRRSVEEATNKAALMRESALKSILFTGVPRVILSLAALSDVIEEDVKEALIKQSRRELTAQNIESVISRGRSLWDSIYEPHADKLHDKLGSYHPDLISVILQSYGSVLAPLPNSDAQGNLGRALTSVVGAACLRTERHVGPQLTSHVFGLLKARNVAIQDPGDAWLSSDEGTEWVIRSADTIFDNVTEEECQVKVKL